MIEDVHIGRCSIDLVRHDPAALWVDRAEHRDLARKAQAAIMAALDAWLATLLAARAQGEEDLAEIRIDLTLTRADFAGAAPFVRGRLRETLAKAVAGARLTPASRAQSVMDSASPLDGAGPERERLGPSLQHTTPESTMVLPALVTACEEGRLGFQLALMRAPALIALASRLMDELGAREYAGFAAINDPSPNYRPSRAERTAMATLREAIGGVVLAHLLVRSKERSASSDKEEVSASLSKVAKTARALAEMGADASRAARREAGAPLDHANAIEPALGLHAAQQFPLAAGLPPGRHACDSLLPFLMLQPLARHGLLPETGDPEVVAQALALIAAGKGDRRRTARLFANSAEELSGARLIVAARRFSDELECRAAAAGAALLAGHCDSVPLLAFACDDELIVVERDGLAPITVLADGDLAAFGQACAAPLHLPSQDRAWLNLLAAIGALCQGASGRDEAWATVRGAHGWIGSTTMEPARAAAAARHAAWLDDGIDRARDGWAALARAPLPVPDAASAGLVSLRRSLGLLAGFTLSEIGLALARRDPASWADPDPLLVIERFASLSGEIVVEPARVTVTLPMGRRFVDLRDAGLLVTLTDVPWWPGRRIDFTGG